MSRPAPVLALRGIRRRFVQGAAVLQAVFLIDWYNATGEDLFAADRFPSLREDARSVAAAR